MSIERAGAADVALVEALLAGAMLPLDGAAEAVARAGVVAREGDAIVGAAALELYGEAGLLRSVVVTADRRGTGLGRAVVAAAEALARDEGVRDLYLITETAIDWFPRLGYSPVERSVADAAVGASVEFTTVCRDKGVPMVRRLG
jgi:amino-acid N-acetyltransferase